MLKGFKTSIKCLLILVMFTICIAGSTGYFLLPKVLYIGGIILYCSFVVIYCYLICTDTNDAQQTCANQNKIIGILCLLVIATTEHIAIFGSSLILLSLIISTFNKKKRIKNKIIMIIIIVVIIINYIGLIPTFSNGNLDIAKRTSNIYCDTSPKGDAVLSMTTTVCDSWVKVDFYLTKNFGILAKKEYLTLKYGMPFECFFLDDETIIIDGEKYIININ